MALISSGRIRTAQELMEQLEQSNNQHEQEAMLAEIRESVKQYEERYGMSSDCIHEAIDAGELAEDLDVCHWIFHYDLLRSVDEK